MNLTLEELLELLAEKNDIRQHTLLEYDQVIYDNFGCFELVEYDWKEGYIKEEQIKAENIRDYLKENKPKDSLIGIASKFVFGNFEDEAHLFLLDFDCEVSDENLEKVERFVQELGFSFGYIFNSGQGYHFYSANWVPEEEWKSLLTKASEYELVDSNWVYFQLRRGYSVLRITANEIKPQIPRMVSALGYTVTARGQGRLFEGIWLIPKSKSIRKRKTY